MAQIVISKPNYVFSVCLNDVVNQKHYAKQYNTGYRKSSYYQTGHIAKTIPSIMIRTIGLVRKLLPLWFTITECSSKFDV